MSKVLSPWAQRLQTWWAGSGKAKYQSKLKFAAVVGVSLPAVKLWFRGENFPRDEQCEKLYEVTQLECFGQTDRDAARAEHERQIPAAVKKARREDYLEHQDERREQARISSKNKYDAKRQRVERAELESLRKDPRQRKNICRNCGEILQHDVGPHLAHCPVEPMSVIRYKEKWGFLRSRNATRSEETQAKQSAAMKKIKHQPPKSTHAFLPVAQEASLKTNVPGSARLEERLNARGKRLGPRPEQWKIGVTDARVARMRLEGKSEPEIAAALGIGETTVFFRLQRIRFPKRARAFIHGEPVSGKHFWSTCEDFDLTKAKGVAHIGVSEDWANERLTRERMNEPVSPDLARKILKWRTELKAANRHAPAAGKSGGHPSSLTQSEKAEIPAKYEALLFDLQALRSWILGQDTKLSLEKIWTRLCKGFRSGQFGALMLWPQFFRWIEQAYSGASFRNGSWRPNEIAKQFLADDYSSTESAIYEVLHRTLPQDGATAPNRANPKSLSSN